MAPPSRTLTALAASVLLLTCSAARGAEPPPLTESDFNIDLFQGPVIGSTRVIGLGGAYAAVSEGAVGIPFNPAAVAHRPYHSRSWFDWDIAFDFLLPGLFQASDFDFDNNGSSTSPDFIVWNLGGMLQFGSFGVGLYFRGQTFEVTAEEQQPASTVERSLTVGLWQIQLSAGYAVLDHQLVLGGGLKAGLFSITEPNTGTLFQTVAGGGEVGLLYRPKRWPFRLAAAFTSPLATANTQQQCEEQQNCPSGMIMPGGVGLPWEVRVGATYCLSSRPFNPVPPMQRKKKKKKEQKPAPGTPPSTRPAESEAEEPEPAPDPDRDYLGGFYLLVTAELGVTGPLDDAIGIDGYLQQVRETAAESVVLSPRLGVETEVWRRRLRLRAGGYWEPSRFADRSGRMHGTFAFDLRLFDFSLWGEWSIRFASAVDLAVRYSNLSLSLGFWH
jgi:hypothetical protein